MTPVLLYTGDPLASYGFGAGHPFGRDRQAAFMGQARRQGLDALALPGTPQRATDDNLLLFHTRRYVDFVRARCAEGTGFLDEGDTPAERGLEEAAEWVVGTTVAAVDALMAGDAIRAMVPIGGLHHAGRDHASGFCIYNDCGVAIERLRCHHGLERVAYVDIDAHHGDGVFYAFESDPAVIFADIHEDGRFLFPGTGHAEETGTGDAVGTKLNIALPPGADDAAFLEAWERVEAILDAHRPEFIILQCGADSVAGDPLTHLAYSSAAHAHAARRLSELANRHAQGRVLALGGGGYDRANIGAAWTAVLQALLETPQA
ncbi:MAG: acetoin utilization protein AcuC [Xanthomonadaceae bacterium]|nr:acetoin utilization protein AcuC [Xanthomonadaceae bacterium]